MLTSPSSNPDDPTGTVAVRPDIDSRAQEVTLNDAVARMASALGAPPGERISLGDRVAIRRWAIGQEIPLVFYRFWLRHVSQVLPAQEDTESWVLLAWALAQSSGKRHDSQMPFGAAIARANVASRRLERLLDAPSDLLPGLFVSLLRQMGSDARFDFVEAAKLLLSRAQEPRERIRRAIAVAYYRNEPMNP